MNTLTTSPARLRYARPANAYYHASPRGTGAAIRFELHPAHGDAGGCLFVELAAQKSVGDPAAGTHSTFDWANRICVKLGKADLSQILQVFRGMQESIRDGKGLLHRMPGVRTVIKFSHRLDPNPGYLLTISTHAENGTDRRGCFFFSPSEAFELALAIESSMTFIVFGIPVDVSRAAPWPAEPARQGKEVQRALN
ncbi:MAG: hypothetical protein ACI4Q3_04305 [Kiritimatiellia bacterium]